VNFLCTVWKSLVEPLNAALTTGKPILKKEEIFSIFGNWEDIWRTHSAIEGILEKRLATPNASVGDIFVDFAQTFQLIYSTYIGNFVGSGARIKRLRRANDRFEKLMVQFENERANTNRLDLGSYLITPIQRLPRYVLLIRQLLEYTPETHPDRKRLLDAQDRIERVANFVNTNKGSSDNIAKLQKIEGSLTGYEGPPLCDPSRKFVREGFLHIVGMENVHSAYFFLLSDMVLYCKYKPGGKSEKEFKIKAVFPLSHVLEVNETLPQDTEEGEVDIVDSNNQCAFELVTEQFNLVLLTQSPDEKKSWVKDIKSCLL